MAQVTELCYVLENVVQFKMSKAYAHKPSPVGHVKPESDLGEQTRRHDWPIAKVSASAGDTTPAHYGCFYFSSPPGQARELGTPAMKPVAKKTCAICPRRNNGSSDHIGELKPCALVGSFCHNPRYSLVSTCACNGAVDLRAERPGKFGHLFARLHAIDRQRVRPDMIGWHAKNCLFG